MTVFYESTEADNPFMESDDEAYDEASVFEDSEARRRGRQTPAQRKQQLMLARQRELARRRAPARMAPTAPPGVPAPAAAEVRRTVQDTQAAVQDVQLETRVQGDDVRRALATERSVAQRQNVAFGASTVAQQVINTLGQKGGPLESKVVQTGVLALPVLALPRVGKGWLGDIRYPVLAASVGIAVGNFFFEQSKEISVVEFVSPPTPTTLHPADPFLVKAIAKNKRGNTLSDVQPVITAVAGTDPATTPNPDPQTGLFRVASSPPPQAVIIKATAKDKTAAAKEVTAQLVIPVI